MTSARRWSRPIQPGCSLSPTKGVWIWPKATPIAWAPRKAGATPNVTMSASESSCSPRLLVEWVIRAMRPSNMSKNMPAKTSRAEKLSVEQPKIVLVSAERLAK